VCSVLRASSPAKNLREATLLQWSTYCCWHFSISTSSLTDSCSTKRRYLQLQIQVKKETFSAESEVLLYWRSSRCYSTIRTRRRSRPFGLQLYYSRFPSHQSVKQSHFVKKEANLRRLLWNICKLLTNRQTIMASSYWESTQRKFWTFTKQELALERKKMEDSERNLVNLYPLPDRRHLSIYFSHRKSQTTTSLHQANWWQNSQKWQDRLESANKL
jgi:hypothetical protein